MLKKNISSKLYFFEGLRLEIAFFSFKLKNPSDPSQSHVFHLWKQKICSSVISFIIENTNQVINEPTEKQHVIEKPFLKKPQEERSTSKELMRVPKKLWET